MKTLWSSFTIILTTWQKARELTEAVITWLVIVDNFLALYKIYNSKNFFLVVKFYPQFPIILVMVSAGHPVIFFFGQMFIWLNLLMRKSSKYYLSKPNIRGLTRGSYFLAAVGEYPVHLIQASLHLCGRNCRGRHLGLNLRCYTKHCKTQPTTQK